MATVDDIITELGGPAEIATKLGLGQGVIRQWKFRGVIPRRAWPDLIAAYPHVTMEALLGAEAAVAA